jgi:acetyl-CoA acetyltransferase
MAVRPAYLHEGTIELSWADPRYSLPDLIFATVRLALDRIGISIGQIDSVVLASHDLVDGRSLSSMTTAPAAGAYLKEEVRISDDAASAVALATAQVRAGQAETCLVAAWGRSSEGDPDRISNALFDPFYSRPLAATELAVSGLRASMALGRYHDYRACRVAALDTRATLAAENRLTLPAGAPPRSTPLPLRDGEVAPCVDAVAATVITAAPTGIEITGLGMSSEPYWLGDRDLLAIESLGDASERALRGAGRFVDEIDVFELDGLTLFDEALAIEAVGAVEPGAGMQALTDARFNPSGGYLTGHSSPVMGLVRTIEAWRALRARPGLTLASGSSTVAGQTHFAIVLEGG